MKKLTLIAVAALASCSQPAYTIVVEPVIVAHPIIVPHVTPVEPVVAARPVVAGAHAEEPVGVSPSIRPIVVPAHASSPSQGGSSDSDPGEWLLWLFGGLGVLFGAVLASLLL